VLVQQKLQLNRGQGHIWTWFKLDRRWWNAPLETFSGVQTNTDPATTAAGAVLRAVQISSQHCSGGRSGYLLVWGTQLNKLLIAFAMVIGQLLLIQLSPTY